MVYINSEHGQKKVKNLVSFRFFFLFGLKKTVSLKRKNAKMANSYFFDFMHFFFLINFLKSSHFFLFFLNKTFINLFFFF